MSFSDAIGQVDQIVQWEQQLADPSALTQTSSTTGTTAASPGDGASGTSFATALAEAQADTEAAAATGLTDPSDASADSSTDSSSLLGGGDSQLLATLSSMGPASSADDSAGTDSAGTDSAGTDSLLSALEAAASQQAPVTSESGPGGGEATSASDPRIQSMTEEANALVGKPYVWGGGHDGWGPSKGYDCSGFVSAVLHAGGYLSTPQDTTSLPSASGIEQGPGQYVTIYDRDDPGQQGHVIIDIAGQFYEAGGEHGSWGGGGGVEEISTPSASYLSTFNQVLHPTGL